MKRTFMFIIAFLMPICLSAGPATAAKSIKIVVSNPLSATDSQGWADTNKPWTEAVEKRTDGNVTFQVYHGGQLISGYGQQPKGIGTGLADMGELITAYNPSEFPLDAIGGMIHPAVERTTLQAVMFDRILFEEIPAFKEQFKNNNLERIMVIGAAGFQLFSTKPIKSLIDFKGIKVRVYGNYQPRVIKAAGAVPVSLGYGEILDGLQKGVIDATMLNPINGRDDGFAEVCKHLIIMSNAGMGVFLNAGIGTAMNLDKWNSLTVDVKRIMLEEAKRIEYQYAEKVDNTDLPKAIQDLQKSGMIIHRLPSEDMAKWGKLCPDFFTEVAHTLDAKGLPGTKTINRFKELCAMPIEELKALYEKNWENKLSAIK